MAKGGTRRHRLRLGRSKWSERRVAAGLSLRDVERISGIHRTVLSALERGQYVVDPEEATAILSAINGVPPAGVTS